MKNDHFEIWITIANENPDFEDFAKAQSELENLGIDYRGKVGIGLTRMQWSNLLRNLSRFEHRFVCPIPAEINGFPVRMIERDRGY
jgi:hypothetical protein